MLETDSNGNVLGHPVIGHTTALFANSVVFLALEVSAGSMQFMLHPEQAKEIGAKLVELANKATSTSTVAN